jgi:molybdenum cofactor biosynthesis enzyme MoaA
LSHRRRAAGAARSAGIDRAIPPFRIEDLALTTNGVLLPEQAQSLLYDAGLRRLNVISTR